MLYELARVLRYPRLQAFYDLPENLVFDYISFLRQSSEIVTLSPLMTAPICDVNDVVVMRDHQGADRVVAGAAASIPNYVGVAFRQARVLCRIQPGIHACENGESARRRHCQFSFVSKIRGVRLVRFKNFIGDLTHSSSSAATLNS
jgi:hypothetical protein